jgi:hypothetical protein
MYFRMHYRRNTPCSKFHQQQRRRNGPHECKRNAQNKTQHQTPGTPDQRKEL